MACPKGSVLTGVTVTKRRLLLDVENALITLVFVLIVGGLGSALVYATWVWALAPAAVKCK